MVSKWLNQKSPPEIPKEGDLYKELTIFGNTFRILYGYYEEFEREGKYNEPMPVYPDLSSSPVYTEEGKPIITAIQDACSYYKGSSNSEGDGCSGCQYFKICEDLFGLCECPSRKRSKMHPSEIPEE